MPVRMWTLAEDGADDALLRSFERMLTPEERARAARFRVVGDQRRSVLSRGLLRHALTEFDDRVAPPDWIIEAEPRGRPRVCGPYTHSISVAHTRGKVIVAVGPAPLDIGVDIEPRAREVDVDAVARRWFSPEESAVVDATPEEDRGVQFLRFWVLKEAYAKACGMGLAVGFDRIRFLDRDPIGLLYDGTPMQGWTFDVLDDGSFLIGYAVSAENVELILADYR